MFHTQSFLHKVGQKVTRFRLRWDCGFYFYKRGSFIFSRTRQDKSHPPPVIWTQCENSWGPILSFPLAGYGQATTSHGPLVRLLLLHVLHVGQEGGQRETSFPTLLSSTGFPTQKKNKINKFLMKNKIRFPPQKKLHRQKYKPFSRDSHGPAPKDYRT